MNIDKNSAVTLSYHLASPAGAALDKGQLSYLHGGYEGIFPKVEALLQGRAAGFAATLDLSVEDAFGGRDEGLARTIAKADFPPGVKVGGQLEGTGDDGSRRMFRVVKIKGDKVLLDANHPLAGQALRFGLKVLQVRAASAEEIAHRHVHGEHGHHH